MRLAVQDLDGAFTLLAIHADTPGVVVGARRNSPLVVGLGDGENFLAPTWRRSSATPATPWSSARTRSRRSPPTR